MTSPGESPHRHDSILIFKHTHSLVLRSQHNTIRTPHPARQPGLEAMFHSAATATMDDILSDVDEHVVRISNRRIETTNENRFPNQQVTSDQTVTNHIVSPKILIVDDDELTIGVIRLLLQSGGYSNLLSTCDDTQALNILRAERPDVVLLDIHMPHISGLSLLEALRQDPWLSRTAVIMLTAATDRESKLHALNAGATDFLSKPVHSGELLARVRNILAAKSQDDQLRHLERQKREEAERELRAAEAIQKRLFPKSAPKVKGFDFAGKAYSAGTGCGDYFDFLTLANENIALVVGDVTGHGMPSALRMMETRAYLRSLTKFQTDVGGILSELNQFMISEGEYGGEGSEQFVTLFLAAIDPDTNRMVYASAGHPGYLLRANGETIRLDSTGFPLGVVDLPIETSESYDLEPGDTLLLVTDGIEESMNPEGAQFGPERLVSTARSLQPCSAINLLEHLHASVTEYASGLPQHDDITAIVAMTRSTNT